MKIKKYKTLVLTNRALLALIVGLLGVLMLAPAAQPEKNLLTAELVLPVEEMPTNKIFETFQRPSLKARPENLIRIGDLEASVSPYHGKGGE